MAASPRLHENTLPGFTRAVGIVGQAAQALRPPRKTLISEWAEAHRQLRNPGAYSGPWRNAKVPYLVEPMDRTLSRSVEVLALAGPAQFAKTELGLNVIGHAVACRPRDMLVVQYSRDMAIDFFGDRVENKLIRPCPQLSALVGRSRSDDKVMEKRFTCGMRVVAAWPVAGQLAGRPMPIQWLDERDRMPDDIGGEGDPVELAKKRGTTFKRNALTIVTSSPGGLHPEDAGPDSAGVSAILSLVIAGDFNLWHWQCVDCLEFWTPGFGPDRRPTLAHLYVPAGATPEIAREKATLICPHCGAEVTEAQKPALNSAGLWLPRGMKINSAGEISGARPLTRTAGYWFSGLASPFRTIGQVAEEWVRAEAHYAKTQDEELLKTCYNTALGIPYRPRAAGALPVEIEQLEARRIDYTVGTVVTGVRYLTAAVDIQARRFAVAIWGWDEAAGSYLVDRFDLDKLADGSQPDPANVAAHWDQLVKPLFARAWPLADDKTHGLRAAAIAIDTGGLAGEDADGMPTEGVAGQAKDFARRMFAGGLEPWRLMLVKGASTRNAPMLPRSPTFETNDAGKRRSDAVPFSVIGVHAIKNVIDNRLRITKAGPGCIWFPADTPECVFPELTAERKKKGKWIKEGPNETWDLAVYCEAARQRLRVERIKDWASPPDWATAKPMAELQTAAATIQAAKPRPRKRVRNKGIKG